MSRPLLQLWLPYFDHSKSVPSHQRDLERAKLSYKNEHAIWLLPNIDKKYRWKSKVNGIYYTEMAIPSESFNLILVVNIDEDGNFSPLYGESLPLSFEKLPQNFFQQFIESPDPTYYTSSHAVEMYVPYLVEGKFLGYKKNTIISKPGIPCPKLIDTGNIVDILWPPSELKLPMSINPTGEIADTIGPLTAISLNKAKDIKGTIYSSANIRWSSPFNNMFCTGANLDYIRDRKKMKQLVDKLANGDFSVKTEADRKAAQFIEKVDIPLAKCWLEPKILCLDSEAVCLCIESKFNISLNNTKEINNSAELKMQLNKKTPVTRCISWIGYFWWELSHLCNTYTKIKRCSICKELFQPKRSTRKICYKQECFKERKKLEMRKERQLKK